MERQFRKLIKNYLPNIIMPAIPALRKDKRRGGSGGGSVSAAANNNSL
jgi:hypothetical protein